ncbi:MAG: c-type cytochrome [Gammaproteobacteria bacterium]|nr:c-type cytochrome [Gammaproteobacteria bacterium]
MPTFIRNSISLLLAAVFICSCDSPNNSNPAAGFINAVMLGGDTTDLTASNSSHGFSAPAANLSETQLATHLQGDAAFEFAFVAAPNNDYPQRDGLGPAFNNNSCVKCHQEDGRGTPPAGSELLQKLGANESLFLRISIEDGSNLNCSEKSQMNINNNWCAPLPVENFGTQLFHRGVADLRTDSPYTGQADVLYRYQTELVTYADGSTITLRKPVFEIDKPYDAVNESSTTISPASAILQNTVRLSARIGPPMIGQGLLEAIREADILALADPDDADADGISGRANYVFDAIKARAGEPQPVSLGRFGWKANNPSVMVQTLGAFNGDMGITSHLFPEESIAGTTLYDNYIAATSLPADSREVSDDTANAVSFYAQTLHVPARRNIDNPEVRHGASLFQQSNCTACHSASFTTGQHPQIAELSNQTIYPFTDMLLHDMGPGLADNRQDFLASGREWKTRPLWGIGLTKTVNPLAGFLHDGRAQSLEEAILWHGGEAEAAKEQFRTLSQQDRDAMIMFLQSL